MTTIDTRYTLHSGGAPRVEATFTENDRVPYFSLMFYDGCAMPTIVLSVDERDGEKLAERLAAAADSILETLRSRRFMSSVIHDWKARVICTACGYLAPVGTAPGPCPRCIPNEKQAAEACEEVANVQP